MESSKEDIRQFTAAFFTSLKADVQWEGETLIVKGVPQDFASFVGKRAPYRLVFERNTQDESTELMVKGSFLLKAMTEYLSQRGQTALVNIAFDLDAAQAIKRHLTLRNSDIASVSKKEEDRFIIRFTFLTAFQYLNEREQQLREIYVEDNKIIDFDLAQYKTIEGRKGASTLDEVKQQYALAREKLKSTIEKRTDELSIILQARLAKEIERIKDHYQQHEHEQQQEREKLRKQIPELAEQIAAHFEVAKTKDRLRKCKERLAELEDVAAAEKAKKEEEFFIADEVHKHRLHIDNKLVSTTIIRYPIVHWTAVLKNADTMRQMNFTHNPLQGTLSRVHCETCQKEINDLALCSGGHITCLQCGERCQSCEKVYCKECVKKKCDYCGKNVCRKCALRCSTCHKHLCKNHLQPNYINGRQSCMQCLYRCSACGLYTDAKHLQKSKGRNICEKCSRLEAAKSHIKGF